MTNLEHQMQSWHERKYGYHKPIDLPTTYRKLLEEVGELAEALMSGDERSIFEEAGDVGFVLAHIIRGGSLSNPSLSHAIACALDKNETRLTQNDNQDIEKDRTSWLR